MATPIHIKTQEVDNETIATTDMFCKICLKNESKYTCPRCNIAYCSVSCYQDEKHTGCSEAFYKDCVISELHDMSSSDADKKKVMEMLSRNLEERTDEDVVENDDEEDPSLSDRLEGLDLDRDVSTVWGLLSPKEKEEFARMLQDGQLAKLIEIWTPWWKYKKNMTLVKEDIEGEDNSTIVPTILTDIPDINTLLKNSRPSSDCRFDLVNILFAYAFVARIHNGDHQDCPVDSSQLLLNTSVVLGCQSQCGSVGEGVQQCLDAIEKHSKEKKESSLQFNLTVLEDVNILISGPGTTSHSLGFMAATLSDVVNLLRKSHKVVKKESKNKKSGDDGLRCLKSQIFKAEKKSVFFLSWLQRYGMAMHPLLPLLQLETERRQSDVAEMEDLKECVEDNLDHLRPKSEQTPSKIVEL